MSDAKRSGSAVEETSAKMACKPPASISGNPIPSNGTVPRRCIATGSPTKEPSPRGLLLIVKCPRDGFVQPKRQIFREPYFRRKLWRRVFSGTRPRSSKLFGPASSGVLRVLRIIQVCSSGFYLCPTALSQPSIGDTRFKSTTVGVVSLRPPPGPAAAIAGCG
jgi:hypothetical protein